MTYCRRRLSLQSVMGQSRVDFVRAKTFARGICVSPRVHQRTGSEAGAGCGVPAPQHRRGRAYRTPRKLVACVVGPEWREYEYKTRQQCQFLLILK